jgi:hypothetical protein
MKKLLKKISKIFKKKSKSPFNRATIEMLRAASREVTDAAIYTAPPSGLDCKVYIDDRQYDCIQGICWGPISSTHLHPIERSRVGGNMVMVIFQKTFVDDIFPILNKDCHLKVDFAVKDGVFTAFDGIVRFSVSERFGISVDDIVTEATVDFIVQERFLGVKDDTDRSETESS